jgi:PucR C-terminal helix-turn-helix domain
LAASAAPSDPSPQALVDALSIAVGRPVLLDDAELAPLAFSRQWDVDKVRSHSILSRGASAEVREALLRQGIESAQDVVRTDPVPDLAMEGRICMPVRLAGEVLGYIWLLDPRDEIGEDQIEQVRRTAREIAALLASSRRREIADEFELLEDLRSADVGRREKAVVSAKSRHLCPGDPVVLCLISATEAGGDALHVVRRAARRLSFGHVIVASAAEGAALVASLGDPVLRLLPESEIATWLLDVSGPALAIGQSAPASLMTLDSGFRQAELALRIAKSRPAGLTAASWSSLGADRVIAQLPPDVRSDFPDPLRRLIHEEAAFAETLAAFLDAAGDVKATAAALSLHRSGLYYRLRRIEEITGLDLDSGDDRLLAQLAIRTERMS